MNVYEIMKNRFHLSHIYYKAKLLLELNIIVHWLREESI